jgi:hypothetical protein
MADSSCFVRLETDLFSRLGELQEVGEGDGDIGIEEGEDVGEREVEAILGDGAAVSRLSANG